jgi:membrane protein DedA with SNARE-associated domain
MNQAKREGFQGDFWRFMFIGTFLYSICHTVINNRVGVERLPFRYFVLSAVLSLIIEAMLYFAIRNWPERRKTAVVWVTGFAWLAISLLLRR